MNDNINPYEILGVSKNYDLDELKQKYKLLAKKFIQIKEVQSNYLSWLHYVIRNYQKNIN